MKPSRMFTVVLIVGAVVLGAMMFSSQSEPKPPTVELVEKNSEQLIYEPSAVQVVFVEGERNGIRFERTEILEGGFSFGSVAVSIVEGDGSLIRIDSDNKSLWIRKRDKAWSLRISEEDAVKLREHLQESASPSDPDVFVY